MANKPFGPLVLNDRGNQLDVGASLLAGSWHNKFVIGSVQVDNMNMLLVAAATKLSEGDERLTECRFPVGSKICHGKLRR